MAKASKQKRINQDVNVARPTESALASTSKKVLEATPLPGPARFADVSVSSCPCGGKDTLDVHRTAGGTVTYCRRCGRNGP